MTPRRAGWALGLATSFLLAASAAAPPTGPASAPASPAPGPVTPVLQPGDAAPEFVMRVLNPGPAGLETVSPRALFSPAQSPSQSPSPVRGLVLSFAAAHCAPCKRELPALARLADSMRERGLRVVVVLQDESDASRDEMHRFLERQATFRDAVIWDRFGLLSRRYGATELPHLVVLGPGEGGPRVRWVRTGLHASTLRDLAETLDGMVRP